MTYPIALPPDNAPSYTWTQPVRDSIAGVNDHQNRITTLETTGGGGGGGQQVIVLTEAPYNADPTGVTAIDTALTAALAALAVDGPTNPTGASAYEGGVIYLPPGYYRQASAKTIASNSTIVRGAGRQATHLFLDPAFPTSTPAWQISGASTVFDSRLENLTLNCNDVIGSIGVQTVNAQEGCGLRGVRVRNWLERGFVALGTGQTSKPAEIVIEDCEFWASGGITSTANGIHFEDCVQACYVRDTTLLTLATNTGGLNAIYLRTANVHVENLHIEDFPNGIYVDTDAALSANGVTSFNGVGGAAAQATINLPNTTNRCTARSINNGTGNILYDARAGMTRGGAAFRFLHHYAVDYSNNDVVVGHFGALDIRKTRTGGGPTAAAMVVKDGTTVSKTASLQQWQDSASAVRAEMYTGGGLRLGLAANVNTNWDDAHLQFGPHHVWVDNAGALRIKNGAPTSATDGTAVAGTGGGASVDQNRNPITGMFHFDGWSPDKTGATDITALLQDAVNDTIAAGGGTLYVSHGRYRINGTVYINMPGSTKPFRLLGDFVDGYLTTPIPTGDGTVFYKANAGDMFRVNQDADNSPAGNWYDYGGSVTFESLAFEGTTGATTYGIRAYRTRFVLKHITSYILDGLMMQDRTGPDANWDNYCDQGLYQDIRFISQKHTAMSLTGTDATVFDRISYQWPLAGAVYGIRIWYGCAVSMNGILFSDGIHNASATLTSAIEVTGGSGFSLNAIHIEEPDFQRFFDFTNTYGVSFAGLHVRFRSRTLFRFDSVRGVTIDGWNAWGVPDATFFDIDAAANCQDITYRGAFLTTFNAGDPTLTRAMVLSDPSGVVRKVTAGQSLPRGYLGATSLTLGASHADTVIDVNTESLTTVTVPVDYPGPFGTVIELLQYGTGQINVAQGTGAVNLRNNLGISNNIRSNARYGVIRLVYRSANEWIVTGDISAT